MIKKLRLWLADKFLSWAMYLDFDMVLEFVMYSMEAIQTRIADLEAEREADKRQATLDTKPKRGRPKGSKDRVGGQRAQS